MAEAEDVLLEAAERATASVRALWRREAGPEDSPGVRLADARPRIRALLRACLGVDLEVTPTDPEPAPGWLRRVLGERPPWEPVRSAVPFAAGSVLFLPRLVEDVRGLDAPTRLRVMALGLGARVASGSLAACPRAPLARDLFWVADAIRVEGDLLRELPGLAADVRHAHAAALADRPSLAALRPAERFVEHLVRHALAPAAPRVPSGPAAIPEAAADPAALAEWARRLAVSFGAEAARYRGFAPVLCFGRGPRPGDGSQIRLAETAPTPPAEPRTGRLPTRSLRRRVESAPAEEEDERAGPFVLPSADPHQSVQDAAGARRPIDRGEVDPDALAEELEHAGRMTRVRSDAPVREILEAEAERRDPTPHRVETATAAGAVAYPEWDHRAGAYRPAWCVVRETPAARVDPAWADRLRAAEQSSIRALRRRFEALRPRRERLGRQLDGEDLDLDAWVEDFADRHAGKATAGRLYQVVRNRRRDLSVLLLVDASASTDGWIGDGRRTIDVEREAVVLFCEALEALGDRHAVLAFTGRGPRDVRIARVKGFGERYGSEVRGRIAALDAGESTRLGAALRHATALLSREPSRLRLVLLLSDGRPNDRDEYEGAHGLEDTRQAVAEARLQGVRVFCLTVDREAPAYLPHLFGPFGYLLVPRIAALPARMVDVYRRLTRGRC